MHEQFTVSHLTTAAINLKPQAMKIAGLLYWAALVAVLFAFSPTVIVDAGSNLHIPLIYTMYD